MKKRIWVFTIIAAGLPLFGCQGKDDKQPVAEKTVQKSGMPDMSKERELAIMFLRGVQNGDKKMMLAATNLTTSIIDDSRDKLIHPAQSMQTEEQRKASEAVLRISGEINYFSDKIRKLFPKSAAFQITLSEPLAATAGIIRSDHTVTITYNNRVEAVRDKTGKQVKVMFVHLQQATSVIDGRVIHSFSFDGKGFERFADKDFDVVSHY